jgi:hypothetical protein
MYSPYKNEYRIFKPVENTIRKNKNSDKPFQAIIHIKMEMSQGNSQCSYLKQTQMPFFLLQNESTGGRTDLA